jgi:hypothetical protein
VRESCGKEHQFRGLVARIVRAVTEERARARQLPRAALDRGADRFWIVMGRVVMG